jgi:hypothetical protein
MKVVRSRVSKALAVLLGVFFMAPAGGSAASGGNSTGRVTICHKGNTIRVGPIAAAWHVLIHGDAFGSCDTGDGSGGGV